MKATGIVRRIDDLGRVVIPKEIRRSMRLHEGDPMEIFLGDDGKSVVFQKYNRIEKEFNDLLVKFDRAVKDQKLKSKITYYNEYGRSILRSDSNLSEEERDKILSFAGQYYMRKTDENNMHIVKTIDGEFLLVIVVENEVPEEKDKINMLIEMFRSMVRATNQL